MRLILLLASVVVCAGCHAPVQRTVATSAASRSAVVPSAAPTISIPVHTVRTGFYTAGQPAASDWATLRAQGITTIINLRPVGELAGRDEAAEVQPAGLSYHVIPVANAEAITPENARRLHQLVGSASGPVLLHCASANRAGGLVALAMAQEHGLPPEQALEIGRKASMKSTEARVRKVLGLPPTE